MYEFTEEDLKYNKRGQLSPSQKEWLKMVARGTRSLSWKNMLIAVGFVFLGACMIAALFLQNADSRAALFADPTQLIILLATVPFVLGILALVLFLNYRGANKLGNAVLSSVSGAVRCDYDSSGESGLTTYFVIVGKKKFKFGDDMSSTFKEGEKYKFYYCKAGLYEFVMSYEKMDG